MRALIIALVLWFGCVESASVSATSGEYDNISLGSMSTSSESSDSQNELSSTSTESTGSQDEPQDWQVLQAKLRRYLSKSQLPKDFQSSLQSTLQEITDNKGKKDFDPDQVLEKFSERFNFISSTVDLFLKSERTLARSSACVYQLIKQASPLARRQALEQIIELCEHQAALSSLKNPHSKASGVNLSKDVLDLYSLCEQVARKIQKVLEHFFGCNLSDAKTQKIFLEFFMYVDDVRDQLETNTLSDEKVLSFKTHCLSVIRCLAKLQEQKLQVKFANIEGMEQDLACVYQIIKGGYSTEVLSSLRESCKNFFQNLKEVGPEARIFCQASVIEKFKKNTETYINEFDFLLNCLTHHPKLASEYKLTSEQFMDCLRAYSTKIDSHLGAQRQNQLFLKRKRLYELLKSMSTLEVSMITVPLIAAIKEQLREYRANFIFQPKEVLMLAESLNTNGVFQVWRNRQQVLQILTEHLTKGPADSSGWDDCSLGGKKRKRKTSDFTQLIRETEQQIGNCKARLRKTMPAYGSVELIGDLVAPFRTNQVTAGRLLALKVSKLGESDGTLLEDLRHKAGNRVSWALTEIEFQRGRSRSILQYLFHHALGNHFVIPAIYLKVNDVQLSADVTSPRLKLLDKTFSTHLGFCRVNMYEDTQKPLTDFLKAPVKNPQWDAASQLPFLMELLLLSNPSIKDFGVAQSGKSGFRLFAQPVGIDSKHAISFQNLPWLYQPIAPKVREKLQKLDMELVLLKWFALIQHLNNKFGKGIYQVSNKGVNAIFQKAYQLQKLLQCPQVTSWVAYCRLCLFPNPLPTTGKEMLPEQMAQQRIVSVVRSRNQKKDPLLINYWEFLANYQWDITIELLMQGKLPKLRRSFLSKLQQKPLKLAFIARTGLAHYRLSPNSLVLRDSQVMNPALLKELTIENQKVDPSHLRRFTNLERLSLPNTQLRGKDLSPLWEMQLIELNLSQNNLKLSDILGIGKLYKLKSLVLAGNKITSETGIDVLKLPLLVSLDLSLNRLVQVLFLAHVPKLEFLDIHDNFITSVLPIQALRANKGKVVFSGDNLKTRLEAGLNGVKIQAIAEDKYEVSF